MGKPHVWQFNFYLSLLEAEVNEPISIIATSSDKMGQTKKSWKAVNRMRYPCLDWWSSKSWAVYLGNGLENVWYLNLYQMTIDFSAVGSA